MKKIIFIILTAVIVFACSTHENKNSTETDIISQSISELKENGIDDSHPGMLFFKRYEKYMSALKKGEAYIDWRADSNPPIYNATVFIRMMDQNIVTKITENTIAGRDAFDGITGLYCLIHNPFSYLDLYKHNYWLMTFNY